MLWYRTFDGVLIESNGVLSNGDPNPWRDGEEVPDQDGVRFVLRDGEDYTPLGYYYREADPSPAPDYSSKTGVTLVLIGPQGQASSRIRETVQYEQITLDKLRVLKQEELSDMVIGTRYANCQTALTPNWVIRVEEDDRAWFAEVNSVLQDRMRDRVYDADPKDYWPRDVPIRAININTNRYISENVNEAQWGQIMKDIGLHGYAIVDASALVQADIDSAYGDGSGVPGGPEWTALAAIDARDPLYGWPSVYAPEVEPTGNGR